MKYATLSQKTEIKKTPALPLPESLTEDILLRLPEVLQVVRIPKSSWWRGIKEGRFPKPIKLGPRTSAWRSSSIKSLIDRLDAESRA